VTKNVTDANQTRTTPIMELIVLTIASIALATQAQKVAPHKRK
tara:strand:- start:298 stop:426 length:129 start_codon:yes stop_codon:yes gene_type:complete